MVDLCAVEGCERPKEKRGWCQMHYRRWQRGGDLGDADSTRPRQTGECSVVGCSRPQRSRQLCGNHYAVAVRHGGELPLARPCVKCGSAIDLIGPGVVHSTASQPSSRKRRSDSCLCADCARQRRYRHGHSAQALAARDGAVCQLCAQPVDMTLRKPDPASPSVDHIVARADGGTDDPANLQLAHLTCNQQKSKRSNWTLRGVV